MLALWPVIKILYQKKIILWVKVILHTTNAYHTHYNYDNEARDQILKPDVLESVDQGSSSQKY